MRDGGVAAGSEVRAADFGDDGGALCRGCRLAAVVFVQGFAAMGLLLLVVEPEQALVVLAHVVDVVARLATPGIAIAHLAMPA